MSGFAYREDGLFADDVPLAVIARDVGTPSYVYSAGAVRDAWNELASALNGLPVLVCYALKANSNLAVVRLLAGLGAGADTVSGGEIERALRAGVRPDRIVYAGVGKTDDELRRALAIGVRQINVESVEEIARVAAIAASLGVTAPVVLRVNPDVAGGGHDKISTGRRGDKFGIPIAELPVALDHAAGLAAVTPVGLHVHIGSQIVDVAAFDAAYRRVVEAYLEGRRYGYPLARLDLGGGLGVRDATGARLEADAYGVLLRRALMGVEAEIILEPGRWLVAEAGVLLTRVIQPKATEGGSFAILDAGMNNFVRPAMYGSRHEVLPVAPPGGGPLWPVDLVGPICESSDVLGRGYLLPAPDAGDLLAITAAGAYGAVMASDYNSRASAAEVLVDGGRWAVVRPSRSVEEQMAGDRMPAWLPTPSSTEALG